MISIAVGGHARKVGKTSVAAGIIAAFPQLQWTAVKITAHQHAGAPLSEAFAIQEETGRAGDSDTSRFLAAGAARALWVRAREDGLDAAMQHLLPALRTERFVIFESNRILRYLRPDVYVLVLRYDVEDFKDSAREALRCADAIVAIQHRPAPLPWRGIEVPSGIPIFAAKEPQFVPEGLVDFIRSRLSLEK